MNDQMDFLPSLLLIFQFCLSMKFPESPDASPCREGAWEMTCSVFPRARSVRLAAASWEALARERRKTWQEGCPLASASTAAWGSGVQDTSTACKILRAVGEALPLEWFDTSTCVPVGP